MLVKKEIKGEEIRFKFKVDETGVIFWNAPDHVINQSSEDEMFFSRGLDQERKAIVFASPKSINGQRIGGITLDDEQFSELLSKVEEVLEKRRRDREEKIRKEEEIARSITQSIVKGETKIKVSLHDHPDFVPGYIVPGEAGRLLVKLGVARYVEGLGFRVDDDLVEELGEEFTFSQAKKYAESKKEEKTETEKDLDKIQEKIEEAKLTGYPVKIMSWTEECDDPKEECSLDRVTVYALPDGSRKTVREHTW